MVVNTRGVEVKDTNYITEAGHYVFKIDKFEEDGYNKFKLIFIGNKMLVVDGKATLSDEIYTHTENYSLEDNMLWKIKRLEIALNAPEVYDVNNFIGRFVRADVTMKAGYTDPSKFYSNVSKWVYSKQNDALPPIPEAQEEQSNGATQSYQPSEHESQKQDGYQQQAIEVDEEIPFSEVG